MINGQPARRSDHYDDPVYDYRRYWEGRDYEHAAEEMAIRRLLDGRHFRRAIDVGGGFGRLSKVLVDYADTVLLAEPSRQQLDRAEAFLAGDPRVELRHRPAADLQAPDASADLALFARVLHHLPDPQPELDEIARVLEVGGTFIVEFANSANLLRRMRLLSQGRRLPLEPLNLKSQLPRSDAEIPFVNHNPKTLLAQLERAGFVVERKLSGSNLRSSTLKRMIPEKALLAVERGTQPVLAPFWFGPSMWLRLRKRSAS